MSTKVTVVEDDPLVARLVEVALGRAGYTVNSYTHGRRALSELDHHEPGLLITDLGLPDISGFELIQEVRARYTYPIMILSAREKEEDFERGYALGADDYLRKPITPAELTSKCRRLVGRHAAQANGSVEFKGYEVDDWLASGGYGDVYRVRDASGALYALKHLREPLARTDEARLRFLREAYTLGAFDHPNVVGLHAIDDQGGGLFYVMDYVPGPTLTDAAIKCSATRSGQVTGLLRPLADVLIELESRQLVHRDLKPSNVVLRDGDWTQPVLLDFGLTKQQRDRSLTLNEEVLGTPGFLPPEALHEEVIDIRGDVFSLGVLGLYAITGHPPFPNLNGFAVALRMQSDRVPIPTGLPPGLHELLRDMTEIEPDRRPRPREIAGRLDALIAAGDHPLELPWLPTVEGACTPTRVHRR